MDCETQKVVLKVIKILDEGNKFKWCYFGLFMYFEITHVDVCEISRRQRFLWLKMHVVENSIIGSFIYGDLFLKETWDSIKHWKRSISKKMDSNHVKFFLLT